MAQLNKDLHLTTEFITLLRAGFYGQIMFESALDTLQSNLLNPKYLDTAHKAFDKIDVWMQDLVTELPIFSTNWQSPETFDAIAAMSFMRELKKEVLWLIPQVETALRTPDLDKNQPELKLLVASLVRSANTRSSYVETIASIYSQLKATQLAEQAALEINDAREYVQVTQTILNTFNTPAAYDPAMCEKLRTEASLTPCDLRALAHDANIMINVYAKEFTFELAEIPRDEAQEWIDKRVPAVAAGYWRAYEFGPDDLIEWANLGVTGAPVAANWRRAGFSAKDAVEWMKEGIGPSFAVPWHKAGFAPARTAAMLRRGITDPAKAPRDNGDED
ncbi:MAG: hypothetical protein ACK5Y6_04875 [Pseudomonadota bacterium]|jgi:hypothetical protein